MLFCNFIMALLDGVGLTMFVPLIQVADGVNSVKGDNKLIHIVSVFFKFIHLEVNVINMLVLIIIIFLLKAVFFYFTQFFQTLTLQSFVKKIRVDLIFGLRDLSYKEFISTDIGRLQSSLIGESSQMAQACAQYIESIKSGMVVFIYLCMAFFIDWKFSILILVGGFLTNQIYNRFYVKTKKLSRELNKNNHQYGGIVIENVNNFKYLKATGRNIFFTDRMLNILYQMIDKNILVGRLQARLSAMREPIMITLVCVIIGFQVTVVGVALSSIMIILMLFYRAMAYLMSMQGSWNNYLATTGSIENIKDYQIYLKKNAEPEIGKSGLTEINKIELKNLSVSFGDRKILNDINVEIVKNQSVALVGESGSGKSTLVNILSGLLKYDTGQYLVNGIDFTTINRFDFKNKIGYISQEPTIFNADIFDNITFWADRTEENINKFFHVAKLCSIYDFINNLPNGYNELLGYNGMNISGGQKQRISIARELFRDVQILIMDEATSALDSETEAEIKQSIDSLKGKITIISIAHRLSTIREADKIFLMNNGDLEISGNFDELKSKSDYFRRMAQLQGL
ncbi:ATP-binding cassette, subfamily B, MsbA [Epilithonimonas pallida]|uniref:ATP-binding cassette, subfamily B, MsbA n=2 Tax=Epilithonimonas pallida TaxID=373671 RepID=A0ABY1R7D9_9FLAO|nr:ATP-binding cassette, subfamily B, MsbA [Epilithonimonas pallida]